MKLLKNTLITLSIGCTAYVLKLCYNSIRDIFIKKEEPETVKIKSIIHYNNQIATNFDVILEKNILRIPNFICSVTAKKFKIAFKYVKDNSRSNDKIFIIFNSNGGINETVFKLCDMIKNRDVML